MHTNAHKYTRIYIHILCLLPLYMQINERLEPYLKGGEVSFEEAVKTAYMDRVDLSAHGFYKVY